jgi:hypothetical protein
MLRPMRHVRARLTRLGAIVAFVVASPGCGESEPTQEEQVRTTLTAFSRATAAKDYQALCDKLLAPSLISDLKKIGLPCEIALQQGLGEVREPRLIIGRVTVKGKTAVAEVRTTAEGEAPSKDTVELARTEAGWRIASLATPSEPGPAP